MGCAGNPAHTCTCVCMSYFAFGFLILGIELRALQMLSRYPPAELHAQLTLESQTRALGLRQIPETASQSLIYTHPKQGVIT